MANFQIFNQGVELATVESETPEQAAVLAFNGAFRRFYEAIESHGPNWGVGSDRINGNGAENFDDCAIVYQNADQVAVIKMREEQFDSF